MEFEVVYSVLANAALDDIYDGVLEVSGSESVANRYVDRMTLRIDDLMISPGMGVLCRNEELATMKIRRLVVEKKYLVYYTVDREAGLIYVVGIVHGARRNPDGYLKKTLKKL